MHTKRSLFRYKISQKFKGSEKIFSVPFARFLEKVTRNKSVKGKKSQPMFKDTFMEVHHFNLKFGSTLSLIIRIIKVKNEDG